MTWEELIEEIRRLAKEHGGRPNVDSVWMDGEGLMIAPYEGE